MGRKRDLICKFLPIAYHETGAIEEYLESMALKGLFFQKRKGGFWYFKKGEPKKLQYYVDVFDGASWFDTRAEERTLDYKEFCEKNGWNYIFTEGKYQYFYSEFVDVIPIETNQEKKLRMIHKASLLQSVILPLMWIFLCILNLLTFSLRFSYNSNALIEISYLDISVIMLWMGLGLVGIVTIVRYLIFYSKNRIRIRNGNEICTNSYRTVIRNYKIKLVILGIIILINLFFSCMENILLGMIENGIIVLVILVALLLPAISGNKRELRSRRHNKVKIIGFCIGIPIIIIYMMSAIILFSINLSLFQNTNSVNYIDENGDSVTCYLGADEIPYTLEDAGYELPEGGYRDSSAYEEKMIFCSSIQYMDTFYLNLESESESSINYEKYEFINKYFCDKWVENYLADRNVSVSKLSDVDNEWSANKAYYIENDKEVLIIYDQKCYIISDNLVDSVELKAILSTL